MPKNCPIGKLAPVACFECICNFGNTCNYQSPEERKREQEQVQKYFKNQFIKDLTLILDFVPMEKIERIAEELIEKGWIRNVSNN